MTETPAHRWPKTGNVGASTHLRDDEQPVTVPARPYPGEFAQLREATLDTVADAFDLPRDLVAKMANPAPTPPTPAELREIAEDLNTHGGLDETFVAGLLHAAVNDMPTPSPSPSTMKPVTYETIMEAMGKFGPLPLAPPEPIKLTREQWDAVPKTSPNPYGGGVIGNPFGVPVELVETVEESTPYRLWLEQAEAEHGLKVVAELPGGAILGNPEWLVDADREFVAHVNDGVDKAALLEVVQAAARRPPEHQHIWTTTSPMRCVDCRRHLTPWWRRALVRARRWTR